MKRIILVLCILASVMGVSIFLIMDNHMDNIDKNISKEAVTNTPEATLPQDNVTDESLISEEEVKQIVWKKVPNAEIVELSLEKDDGRYEYEGTAILDGYEYEFEINGSSGIILKWEKERIERID